MQRPLYGIVSIVGIFHLSFYSMVIEYLCKHHLIFSYVIIYLF